MSTNYTEHLGLTLWEANDPVLRTEFNANHTKLDAALKALSNAHGCVTGTYAGGALTDRVVIDASFRPSLAIIMCEHPSSSNSSDVMCLLAINNITARMCRSSSTIITIENLFTDTGLTLMESRSNKYGLNYTGRTYYYTLFK